MMPQPEANTLESQPFAVVNSLLIKALEAPNRQALQFIIANDTHKLIKYDRAILWEISQNKAHILTVSGQASLAPATEFYKKLNDLPNHIVDPSFPQLLSVDSFKDNKDVWTEYQRTHTASILWLPIYSKKELCLGLWLEKWNVSQEEPLSQQTTALLSQYLLPGYGAIWGKFKLKSKLKSLLHPKRGAWLAALGVISVALFLIHIPLRIVAPCEIVPKDPVVITAPLLGTIDQIVVKPGAQVHMGDILFTYDRRLHVQELKVAQNEVAITDAALNRALELGLHDQASLDDVAILKLKLEKDKINLDLARNNVEQLDVKSPNNGAVIISDPDQWPGKPVHIGEKVMMIADLSKTKIKMWIPENDNVDINPTEQIKIFLNVYPEKQWTAKLQYIASEVTLSDAQVPSFVAEADWEKPNGDVKAGLKGTAVLYGPKVSLFYYIFRKPWIIFRHIFGV